MMKKHCKKLFALLLTGAMLLALPACTSGEGTGDDPDPSTESPAPSSLLPDGFEADPAVEDLCLATAGVPGDFALFTVNGTPVTARAYLYWLAYHLSYSSSSPKEDACQAATQYSIAISKAKELGCELTQEQSDELDASLALTIEYLGGEEAFADELRMIGLDEDTFYDLNAASYYYAQLRSFLFASHPTAEEMDEYIEENDLLYAKHILLMTIDDTREPLDEATIAEKKATAENLLSQLQSSSDLLTDFDTLMHEYSEDTGLIAYPDGYTFTAGEMVSEFEEAARTLEYGEMSGIVESEFGYHIILRLDPDTDEARETVRDELMDEQMTAWMDEAVVVFTDEYEALDPDLFFEKYIAYQEAFAAQRAAEAEAAAAAGEQN